MRLKLLSVSFAILALSAAGAQAAALGGILQGTPWWVYPLLTLLVFLGLQAAKPRTVPVARVLITPAIFIAWGIASLVARPSFSGGLALDWLITACCGGAVAVLMARGDAMRLDRERHRVHLPGSLLPLARNLLIFAAKYGLAVAVALAPAARDQLALWDIAVSGASAGYFLAWLARILLLYRAAPDVALTRESPKESG
jgi:hypothetical protein